MKTMKKFLSMTALALVGAMITGCSSDDSIIDNPQQPENTGKTVTLTTTVGLGGDTRALASDGTKTFAAGETMAVIYKNTSGTTVKAVSAALTASDIQSGSGNKTATFTFTLENPDKGQNVTYIYPAAMAGTTDVNYSALNSQDGSLATLSSNLDLATYSGAWDGASLPSATLTNQLAFLAVTLKDAGGSSEITSSITGMTISDGTYNYAVSRSAAAGPIYVAIRPTASANIEVTATDGSTDYTKSLTDKTYAAGNGYNVSWRIDPVTYTELKGGEVLHVGDIINSSEEILIEDIWKVIGGTSDSGSPYTVLRADYTPDGGDIKDVNEKADGNYYVLKSNTGKYINFVTLLRATGTSDGILVTYTEEYAGYKNYRFTVHEP